MTSVTDPPSAEPDTALGEDPSEVVEREVAVLFRRARAWSIAISREIHPDLEPATYSLLVRLRQTGAQRMTDIAKYFGIGKPSVSRQVQLLERLGLVERGADPDDRRSALLSLTDEGARRLTLAQTERQARFRALLGTWPAEDVRLLGRMLERFNELQAESEEG